MSERKQTEVQAFTIFKNEGKNGKSILTMRPNLGQYGVKGITVHLNDGNNVELNEKSALFLNDAVEKVEYLASKGIISAEAAERRLAGIRKGCVSKEVKLKL